MTLLMDSPKTAPLCEALNARRAEMGRQPELLFAYGGVLSYEIEWMLEHSHSGSRILWLVPQDPPHLSQALTDALFLGRLAIAELDAMVEKEFFKLFDPRENLSFVLIDAGRLSAGQQGRCTEVLLKLREKVRLNVFNAGTMVTKGPLWQSNTLQNLSCILRSPGTDVLHDAFTGRPAIVVGAGPSLSRILPALQRVRNRFVIIATGTALAPLRAAGIRPDLVVAVDGSHLIARQFECDCDDLYLAASTLVYSGITRRFKGNFFGLLDLSPIDQWVKEVSPAGGKLYAGGTVTACGMDLAASMGCDPIVTVGLDLSFADDGRSHADGTMYDGKPLREALVPVPSNFQEEVYTSRQFACYIEIVQMLVADRPGIRFVNVNDGGARIDGMELAGAEFLSDWNGPEFDAFCLVKTLHGTADGSSANAVCSELLQIAEYLGQVQNCCRQAAMTANRLLLMQRSPGGGDPAEMKQCLAVIREVDEILESGQKQCAFLQMSLWPAAYELSTGDSRGEQPVMGRMRRFYEQIAGAAKWTRELVLRACRELEADPAGCKQSMTGEDNG